MAYPNDVAKVEISFLLPNADIGVVVHHVQTQSGTDFDQARCEQVCNLYEDWITNANFETETNAPLINYVTPEATVLEVTTTGLETPATPTFTNTLNLVGANPDLDPLPNESAWVTTYRTAFTGRSYRGRSFWPAAPAGFMQTNGTIQDSVTTAMQETVQALIDGLLSDGGFRHVVHSRLLGVATPTTVVVARDVLHHISNRNG
jgi:hypothetical protein